MNNKLVLVTAECKTSSQKVSVVRLKVVKM